MAKTTVPFNHKGVGKLPDDKPVAGHLLDLNLGGRNGFLSAREVFLQPLLNPAPLGDAGVVGASRCSSPWADSFASGILVFH